MRAFLAAILLGATVHAQSAIVTLDFEGVSPNQWFNTNIVYRGLRFSPGCTHRIVAAYGGGTTDYLSTDSMNNCGQGADNANYLGTVATITTQPICTSTTRASRSRCSGCTVSRPMAHSNL